MSLNLTQFKRAPFIVLAVILLIVLLFDFVQRVWQPLNPRELSDNDFADVSAQLSAEIEQPDYLREWLRISAEGETAAGANGEAEAAPEVVAMAGSTPLERENVRIRAIFISGEQGTVENLRDGRSNGARSNGARSEGTRNGRTASSRETQAIAIAEVQDRESGTVSRVQWRTNDEISGWVVSTIAANRVVLTRTGANEQEQEQQQIELYVFEPLKLENVVPEDESGINNN